MFGEMFCGLIEIVCIGVGAVTAADAAAIAVQGVASNDAASELGQLDTQTIKSNAARQAYGYETQATPNTDELMAWLSQERQWGDVHRQPFYMAIKARLEAAQKMRAAIENARVINVPKCEGGGKAINAVCFGELAEALYQYDKAASDAT